MPYYIKDPKRDHDFDNHPYWGLDMYFGLRGLHEISVLIRMSLGPSGWGIRNTVELPLCRACMAFRMVQSRGVYLLSFRLL